MESEDTCSCTPQDQSEYWESLKTQFEDQSIMLKAKELELREKIAQVESLIADQSSSLYSRELSSEIPRVFPRRPESPERDATPSLEPANKCPAGFFQKVMENAKSILTMKCSAIHPSNTASEEPTRETDSNCLCDSETQQTSKSTSSRAVSFETVPQPRGSSSEYCLCDKDSTTKNDTTADSYSQEVNNSFSCSVTCSSEASPTESRKEGYNCSSCCLASSTPTHSKASSRGVFSYNPSTYASRRACSCNTSKTQAVGKDDKLSEALVDTASRDTRMVNGPCQICFKRRIKSLSDQQTEARITFDTKPPGKTSACQVCLEIKRLAQLSDKQVEAQAVTATKATKATCSTCRICLEQSDKQIAAQTATSSKQIEAVSASVSRATRITNSSCRICLERRSQSASKAISGQFLIPDKQPEVGIPYTSRAARSTCREFLDRTIKTGAVTKDKEKPSFVNLQSCWVNPLQNSAKKSAVREMMPLRDNASPNQQAGDVSCTAATCPVLASNTPILDVGGVGEKGVPCSENTCPDFRGENSGQLPCREDTCPDFRAESSGQLPCKEDTCSYLSGASAGQLPCREDTCPDFRSESSGQLPCKEDTCSYLSGNSARQLPCREETCPDFGGSKRGCRDDTCPVVAAITKSLTAPNVSFGKRTEKRKSTCSIGTCPSAKRVRSKSNIRDMDNQCAFIGSPVLNTSNFKGFGDMKYMSTTADCCCCTDKEEPLPDTTTVEKCMKCHMQELLEREKNYDSVFQTFQNMANQPTYCCVAAAEKNNAQGDVRRITDELKLENQILKSELMELKYEMKQCLEKVEGPMKQKLQTEKCKCAKLQHELAKTSENMVASQDTYMREMNALKLQLCVACSNMTDLNSINKRLKEEMKSLDCMCSKLEDDLVKQKLNEADTIRMLTKRGSVFGDTEGTKPAQPCTPRPPKKPQETQSETFKCDSNLHVIARKLSKTLKESAPCEECSKLPELTGAAKLIKDLTDLVESRKIERSSLDSMAIRRDCACQSPPQTEDEWCQCNNFRDVGAGEYPVRAGVEDSEASKDEGGLSKPTETLFSVPPTFAEKNKSSHFDMKPTTTPSGGPPAVLKAPSVVESRYYSAHDAPCPVVCDEKAPCAPIQRPCLVSRSETSPDRGAKIRADQIPDKVTVDSGTEPCPEICGDSAPCATFGTPCASSKKEIDSEQPPEKEFKETGTVPCPVICADSAPCVAIGKPCVYSEGLGDKAPEDVPAETTDIGKEPEQPSPKMTPKKPSPCPQICSETAPCFSFGRPCQLPEGLGEAIKRASVTSTEEAVRYITSILLKNEVPADSKQKTLALVEPKDVEILPEGRPAMSSAEEAVNYISSILVKNMSQEISKEKPIAVVESKDRDVPPEGTVEVPKTSSQIGEEEVEDATEQETDKKSGEIATPLEVSPEKTSEELPTELPKDEPIDPSQKETPGPELAVEESPTDEPATEEKTEEVAETVIHEIVPAQVQEGKESAHVSNASSQVEPGEEMLIGEVILDSEPGGKVDKISQSTEKKLFEEIITGDLPFTVDTQAIVLEEPPSGLHVTTTVTSSGNLEVITEGPAGLIETTLTYKEDGTIEVVTQITELSRESLDTGDTSTAATEAAEEKKRSSKLPGGTTPSPEAVAKFDQEKQKLILEAKQKDSLLSGDSELTGLETVSDYTKDTTALSSTGKSSATEQIPKDKGTDFLRTDTVTQQTAPVPTYTKSSGGETPEEAATSTDVKPRKESEAASHTTTGEVAVSSHVMSTEKATAEATEKSDITVRTSPISTKETATESARMTESTRQQTSPVETVGQLTESEPGVTQAMAQDASDARGFGKGDVETGESTDTSDKFVQPVLTPVQEATEESTSAGTEAESSGHPSERGKPVSKSQQDEEKPASKSWQTEESDERTNVSDIAEDASYKPVKQAAIRQKRDCSCQSSAPAEQSSQCCDCKDVGVSTSKDNETNTEPKMTKQKLPVKNTVADGEPKSASDETAEGTQSSRGDTAEAGSLETGKAQGTSDEMSTLNEDTQHDTKQQQDKSNAQEEFIASGEPRESQKPTSANERAQTAPIQREAKSEPSESYKSAQGIESSPTRDIAKGKHSSGSESDDEKKRKSPEKAEAKRKSFSEVPDSVSKLSDKDNPPPVSGTEGKRQKKKRSSKLDYSSCDCPGVCQCVVCSPEIISKRKEMTGTADPPDRQSEILCCCTYPQPTQRTQAVYMQVPHPQTQEPTHYQPGCSCCCPPRTEAFLRSTNLAVNQGALPKDRRHTSIDDVFLPTEDKIDQRREAPSKKLPHARSCECIDCLCLPKIQKIAQMREFPTVNDEKQIYQVSTMKCECINAINARKLALERSRIPIATNSNANPPKVRAPTPATCTCDDCRCSPGGDQAKAQPAPRTDPVTRADQVASKLGGMTPSQLAKLCDCQQCDCSVCFNKPAPIKESKSTAQEARDQPKETKSATPTPSLRNKTKNCCCKGECTCEPCPVDDDKAKEAPSKMSKKESEKLVKASTLSRPEDCDCVKCVCPMTDESVPQDSPAAPPEPPHSEDAPAKLPSAASKMSKADSKSNPPAETQPGAYEKPPDCDCHTCDCPETGATNAQGDQAEECTCAPCVCPGAATVTPSVLQPIPEKVPIAECDCSVCECSPCADPKKRKPLAPPKNEPVPCDCLKCECEPCADPAIRSEPPAPKETVVGDVRAVSKDKRDTDSKSKAPEPHPDDCICAECLCLEEANLPVKVPHPDNCPCPECLCLEEVMVTASDFSQGVPTKASVGIKTDTEAHPKECPEDATQTEGKFQHGDGCKCPECHCVECYEKKDRFTHALECQCGDCLCTDCSNIGQKNIIEKDKNQTDCVCSSDSLCEVCYFGKNIEEYKECKCGVCLCQDCAYMVANPTAAEDKSVAPETSAVKPSGSCHCIDCQCDICTKEKPTEAMQSAEVGKTEGHPETCTCLACMCIECFDKKNAGAGDKSSGPGIPAAASVHRPTSAEKHNSNCKCVDCRCLDCGKEGPTPCPPLNDQVCRCGDCTCVECAYKPSQQTQPSASPEKTQGDKCSPDSKKETVDKKFVDPPPFETPLRNSCDCDTCPCVICVDKRKAAASTAAATPSPPAQGEAPPFEVPVRLPCSCAECTCPVGQKEPGALPVSTDQKNVSAPATAEAPFFEVPIRLPCTCATCTCPSCNKEGGKSQIPQDPRLVQNETDPLQSEPTVSVSQKENIPDRPSSAPGSARPVSRIHCECPTCVCPENALNFQAGRMSGKQSTEIGQESGQPSHMSGKPSNVSRNPQVSAQTSHISGKQSQPGKPLGCECSSCKCPNLKAGKIPSPSQQSSHISCQPSQTLGKPQVSAQTPHISGKQSQPGKPSSPVHCECPSCQCPNFLAGQIPSPPQQSSHTSPHPSHMSERQSAQISFAPSVSSQKQSTLIVAQPSHISAKPCAQMAGEPCAQISAQTSHIAGQATQVAAQTSHISGKQSTQAADQIPACDCPTCVCFPCPDTRISHRQQQAKNETGNTETHPGTTETHPENCACSVCCDLRMAAIDLTKLNDEALEKKIQKDTKENCECREQIKEIRKALTKIKCACTTAELKAMKSKPLVKQASTFGQTMSGLKLALTNLQEKCKAKDKMIDAMTGELKQRTSSKTFDSVLNKSVGDAPDYDKAGDVRSSDPSHEVISTNVLYTVEEEREAAAKGTFDAKLSRAMETEKKKKKKSCKCGKSHRSKDLHNVDLSGFEIVDIRRITQDSVIIKWKPPRVNSITGYDIYINGVNKSKVMSGGRTSAMIHSLDLSATIQVTIYAVTKCGRCEPPAIAIYEVRP